MSGSVPGAQVPPASWHFAIEALQSHIDGCEDRSVADSSSDRKRPQQRFDWVDRVNVFLIACVLLYVVARASVEDSFRLHTGSVSAQARDLLWFALACGLLSFATIECIKRLTYVRAAYHVRETRHWLESRFRRLTSNSEDGDESPFKQLVTAMGIEEGDEPRVFNLPSEQLSAQISAAADLALTTPYSEYSRFLASVTGDERDLMPLMPQSNDDREQEVEDLRRGQQVRIGLDQLQVVLRDRWRRYLWGAGLWISGAYGVGLALAGNREAVEGPRHVLAALVLGGVVAAVARDLTAIVERLRG
jgi:hypothetical protein